MAGSVAREPGRAAARGRQAGDRLPSRHNQTDAECLLRPPPLGRSAATGDGRRARAHRLLVTAVVAWRLVAELARAAGQAWAGHAALGGAAGAFRARVGSLVLKCCAVAAASSARGARAASRGCLGPARRTELTYWRASISSSPESLRQKLVQRAPSSSASQASGFSCKLEVFFERQLQAERPAVSSSKQKLVSVTSPRCRRQAHVCDLGPTRGMARGKAAKKVDGGRGRGPKRPEPEPPSAEAQAALADAEAKQAQLAEELRTVEQQARRPRAMFGLERT